MFAAPHCSGFEVACYVQVVKASTSGTESAAFHPPFIVFDSITSGDRTFQLKSGLAVPVSRDENLFVLESKGLHILAYGDTIEGAASEFQDHFAYLWDSIVQQPDTMLTPDARRAKRAQLNLVSLVATAA